MSDDESAPRWLDDGQREAWIGIVGMMLTLPAALDGQLQRDHGVTLFGYLVMAGLSDAPDRTLRMSDLAALANGSLSRLSHAVARLEKRGWVARAPCPSDGRFTIAVLTDRGAEKLAATAPGHVAEVRRLLVDVLGDEELLAFGAASRSILAALGSPLSGLGRVPDGAPAGSPE